MYEFSIPTSIIFGVGTIDKIGEFLAGKEHDANILLVTGSGKLRDKNNKLSKWFFYRLSLPIFRYEFDIISQLPHY